MRKKLVSIVVFLILAISIAIGNINAIGQVSVEFMVKNVWWGTYQNRVTPEPGDKDVPLTVVIQQKSSLYLRGVVGYLNLTEYFRDSQDNDNVSTADGIAIETDNEAKDIIPFGSFYMTFYLDISENATKGEYTFNLRITGYAYNNTSYYEIIPADLTITVMIPNRAPEIKDRSPDSNTVTVYLNETQTFSVDASDPDGDKVTLEIDWYINGKKVYTGDKLPGDMIKPGDVITCKARPFDGSLYGSYRASMNSAVVQNTPPKFISKPGRFEGKVFKMPIVVQDPDGDSVSIKILKAPTGSIVRNDTFFFEYKGDTSATFPVVIEARDSWGGVAKMNFTIKVKKKKTE